MTMKNKIAQTLKRLRNDLNYSTEYVSDTLQKLGISISPNTLYNYENGVSQPKADMFLYLCKIYGLTDFNIFFDEEPTGLSQSDKNLLEAYHAHPEMQAAINKMLDFSTSNNPLVEDLQKEFSVSPATVKIQN